MRLDSDQSRTVQRSTLMDLPPLLPALPYRSVTDCAHTPTHSISLYLGLTLRLSLRVKDVQVQQNLEAQADEEDDPDDGDVEAMVSAKEARLALATLRRYSEQQGVEDLINHICVMDQQLNKHLLSNRNQKAITDFFKQV